MEVAAGRRRRAQQVSRGHSCNLMWHGFGQLWIALFCLPHVETAMPHLLTHFRIITQWQGQDMTSHRMPQIDALVVQPLSASKLLLLSFILPNWSVFSLTCRWKISEEKMSWDKKTYMSMCAMCALIHSIAWSNPSFRRLLPCSDLMGFNKAAGKNALILKNTPAITWKWHALNSSLSGGDSGCCEDENNKKMA